MIGACALLAARLLAAPAELAFAVEPYLQWPTPESITVRWETDRPSTTVVHYGLFPQALQRAEGERGTLKEIVLRGLKPETHYLYRVESVDEQGRALRSELLSFRTAPAEPDRAVRFTVVGDTQADPQADPEALRRIGELMWNERPDFVLVVGDLVSTGTEPAHWTGHFFPNLRPLLSRVPLLPVMGNHDKDFRLYKAYMSLPEPEHRYRFAYGPVEIFVLDSDGDMSPGGEQGAWLERALA